MNTAYIERAMTDLDGKKANLCIDAAESILADLIQSECPYWSDDADGARKFASELILHSNGWIPGEGFHVELGRRYTRSGNPIDYTIGAIDIAHELSKSSEQGEANA